MVGAIASFNPLFVSANYVDKAVDSLVFKKFIYINSDGNPTSGVAKEWTVSEDNLTYTFTIDSDLYWQDGQKVSAEDVFFTFETAVSCIVTTILILLAQLGGGIFNQIRRECCAVCFERGESDILYRSFNIYSSKAHFRTSFDEGDAF
jgi:hypothetical protein